MGSKCALSIVLICTVVLLAAGCFAEARGWELLMGFQWATKFLTLAGAVAGVIGAGWGALKLGDKEEKVRARALPMLGGGAAVFVPCSALTLMPLDGNGLVALAATAGVAAGAVGVGVIRLLR